MAFEARAGANQVVMDTSAPLGQNTGMSPKELVVTGLGGCTAMDVVGLMKKHKQDLKSFTVDVEVEKTSGVHPAVFTKAMIQFRLEGTLDKNIVLESVRLSQTKYCGVSAMLSKAFPIAYEVYINGEMVGTGHAQF